MQKIVSQEEKDKITKRNRTIIGFILGAILIVSTAGIWSGSNSASNVLDYKGVKFSMQTDNRWAFTLNSNNFLTLYNAKQTEDLQGQISLKLADYQEKPLYFSYDSEIEGVGEITGNIGTLLSRNPQKACLGNETCDANTPVKNCSDNIIIIQKADENMIKQDNNCVYISAKSEDISRASDAFIFKILGLN